MKSTKGKHFKKRKITLTDRFYALMIMIIGIVSIFIFKSVGETDMTGSVFAILFGLLTYIGTYGEDK